MTPPHRASGLDKCADPDIFFRRDDMLIRSDEITIPFAAFKALQAVNTVLPRLMQRHPLLPGRIDPRRLAYRERIDEDGEWVAQVGIWTPRSATVKVKLRGMATVHGTDWEVTNISFRIPIGKKCKQLVQLDEPQIRQILTPMAFAAGL